MIRFAADEDLDNHIVRGLRRRLPTIDIVTVQEAGLSGTLDRGVLAWAALSERVLLSHDASTIIAEAYTRIAERAVMPGVLIIPQSLAVGLAIEDILIVAECSLASEWIDRVGFLPLT